MKKIFTLIAAALMAITASAATTVGAEDNSAGWWSAFSDYYTVKEGQKAHITFKNYSNKEKNWNNWLLVTNVAGTVRDGEGYKEYFVARVDNYGWGDYWNKESLKSDYNWDTFTSDMDGSSVAMDVYNEGGIIYGSAVITTAAGKTYNYSFNSTDTGVKEFGFFLTVEYAHLTDVEVTIEDPVKVEWTTTAVVSQFGVGGVTDAQRTLNYMSDGTFVVKEAFGAGTSDINLVVNEYGGVDFVGVTPGSDYYSYLNITGSDAITSIAAYGMGYNSCTYTLNNDGVYFKVPTKAGGELATSYTAYAYNGTTSIGSGVFYVCWGKTRYYGTTDHQGKAYLVYSPKEGTEAAAGDWKEAENAAIGFYYDELAGDTCYRINNWYGVEGKSFYFKTTDNGTLTFYATDNYIYTDDATIPCLLAYPSYSYTWGDESYYVKDLTKLHDGEIGFYALGYDASYNQATGASDWQKNYYIFSWENTDNPSAISTAKTAEKQLNGKFIKNGRLVIMKNGREYNAAGQLVK